MGYSTVRMKSDRKRSERDFYPTPVNLCSAAVDRLLQDEGAFIPVGARVIDPGCGTGNWGRALYNKDVHISGIDIADCRDHPNIQRYYHTCMMADYTNWDANGAKFDIAVGNPPFNQAEQFVRKSMEIITDHGYIYFFLRLAFLEGRNRQIGLFKDFPPKRVYVLTRRPSFFSTKAGRETTDTLAYAMFLWQRGWNRKTELDWMYWENKSRSKK